MTRHSLGVYVTFCLLVVPFLGASFPDFCLPTNPARERLVDIVLRQLSVRIDVIQFCWIGQHGRRMAFLLLRCEPCNPLRLPEIAGTGISAAILFLVAGHLELPNQVEFVLSPEYPVALTVFVDKHFLFLLKTDLFPIPFGHGHRGL